MCTLLLKVFAFNGVLCYSAMLRQSVVTAIDDAAAQ